VINRTSAGFVKPSIELMFARCSTVCPMADFVEVIGKIV